MSDSLGMRLPRMIESHVMTCVQCLDWHWKGALHWEEGAALDCWVERRSYFSSMSLYIGIFLKMIQYFSLSALEDAKCNKCFFVPVTSMSDPNS